MLFAVALARVQLRRGRGHLGRSGRDLVREEGGKDDFRSACRLLVAAEPDRCDHDGKCGAASWRGDCAEYNELEADDDCRDVPADEG